jgi:hypothetical protein
MNRRAFFKRTLGALAAAAVAPHLPSPTPILTFKGTPFTFDRHAAKAMVFATNYGMRPNGVILERYVHRP